MSTLIEKLERESDRLHKLSVDFSHDTRLRLINEALGIYRAIDIVKKHQAKSDWISVDERLPEPNKIVLVAVHYPQYYVPDFMYVTTADYDEVRKKWSSITNVAELKNVVYWQPFPKLPKPPSEVQE